MVVLYLCSKSPTITNTIHAHNNVQQQSRQKNVTFYMYTAKCHLNFFFISYGRARLDFVGGASSYFINVITHGTVTTVMSNKRKKLKLEQEEEEDDEEECLSLQEEDEGSSSDDSSSVESDLVISLMYIYPPFCGLKLTGDSSRI